MEVQIDITCPKCLAPASRQPVDMYVAEAEIDDRTNTLDAATIRLECSECGWMQASKLVRPYAQES